MDIAGYGDLLPLSTGASSDVYRAQSQASARWVAVKVFRFALTGEAAERRFLDDCDVAQSVSTHPHVATLYEAGLTSDRRPYLITELVDGGSVADHLTLDSGSPFVPTQVARIGIAVAGALEAAHGSGAFHRLLQPTNILLAGDGDPLVTELGVTLFAERWEASGYLGNVVPFHAAPEVLRGEPATPASDVYSLASTLSTMLTGAPPHYDAAIDSAATLLQRVAQQEPPSLSDRLVPPGLETIIRAGLEVEPGRRTPTATAFREQLDEILAYLDRLEQRSQPDEPGPAGAAFPVTEPSGDPSWSAGEAPAYEGTYAEDEDSARPGAAFNSPGALEPVAKAPAEPTEPTDRLRGWRRGAAIGAGAAVIALLALTVIGLVSDDADPEPAADRDTAAPDETPPPSDVDRSPPAGPGADTDGGTEPPDELVVPTGLEAHTNAGGGVQLDWDETDTDSFAVLVLSETSPPRLEMATEGPSLFIPAIDLSSDGDANADTGNDASAEAGDGNCFAVARLDMVAGSPNGGATTSEGEGPDGAAEIGPAFSSVVCIRGAAEDTIRTE